MDAIIATLEQAFADTEAKGMVLKRDWAGLQGFMITYSATLNRAQHDAWDAFESERAKQPCRRAVAA